jgi:hypothetical protein
MSAQPPSAPARGQGPFMNTACAVTPASVPPPRLAGHDARTCCADAPASSSQTISADASPPRDSEMVHEATPELPEPPPQPSAPASSAINGPAFMPAKVSRSDGGEQARRDTPRPRRAGRRGAQAPSYGASTHAIPWSSGVFPGARRFP